MSAWATARGKAGRKKDRDRPLAGLALFFPLPATGCADRREKKKKRNGISDRGLFFFLSFFSSTLLFPLSDGLRALAGGRCRCIRSPVRRPGLCVCPFVGRHKSSS
ncbi:hypothetical protein [Pandoravirus japonicus]|uniref:Uncharacterized protein n=1 Tax=Pandoravirus japonicus TaxID=2823154 RepID=A0A811BNG1_9VIRU|nr:hypothetical protein [Pandoravirus japonicus]